MNSNDAMNDHHEINDPSNDSGSDSVSTSWRDDGTHQSTREELISQRRRCFLFVSLFPFLISAIALFTMLAFNSGTSGAVASSSIDSVSLRGNSPNGNEMNTHVEASYLADNGGAKATLSSNEASTTSSTVLISTATAVDTSTEDVLDSFSTSTPETTTTTTSPPQSETASTTLFTLETAAMADTTAASQSESTSAMITTANPTTIKAEIATTPQPDPTTAAAAVTTQTSTEPTTCEEAATHESCINHSANCVWFSPLNWQELCFTKPDFPLNKCKEVRLMDDCVESAVGCVWVVEKVVGEKGKGEEKGEDICRFMKENRLRMGKAPKHFW